MKRKQMIIVVGVLSVLLVLAILAGVFYTANLTREVRQAQADNEQLQLDNEQLRLTNEFDAVNAEFQQYEIAAQQLRNDSIFAKYTAAKQRVAELTAELHSERVQSRERINQLNNEIATLRGLLRHYISQIDSLSRENNSLRAENAEIRNQNQALSSNLASQTARADGLAERMVLAEKLNVTGVTLTGLKSNGKVEKNITKARQLRVMFTIPQNNSTPVGSKTIYLRLTNPEGQLLGSGGHFSLDGGSVACTAKKVIEYSGDEISGITFYWDVNTALNPGEYTVELFCDGYRLTSRRFQMQK